MTHFITSVAIGHLSGDEAHRLQPGRDQALNRMPANLSARIRGKIAEYAADRPLGEQCHGAAAATRSGCGSGTGA